MRFTFGFLGVCVLSALFLASCGSEAASCEGVECEDDGNECTHDECDPATGTCHHVTVEDDTPCDFDGLPGLCQAGVCVDAMLCEGVVCEDDGNECAKDACSPSTGSCENTPVHDGTPCAQARGGCYDGLCNFRPVSVTVGDKELVFDWTTDRCEDLDVPDAPADFARDENGGLVLFDGNAPTYYVSRGADFDSLTRVCDPPALVSADLRTPESYENWEWLRAIYREGSSWHALIHNEFHDAVAPTCKPGDPSPANLCWYNSITYAASTDGGRTFTKPSPPAHVVAPAPKPWLPPTTPVQGDYLTSGYFLPSSVVRGPEDYYYTVIGAKPEQAQGGLERGLCAVRTKTLGDPTSWRAWDGSGFNLALESPYEIDAVAQACAFLSTPEEVYPVVGSLDLTYNSYLERYMLVTQWAEASNQAGVRCGFYFSLSTDLIHWSQMQEIAAARIVSPACPPDQMAPGQLEPVLIHYPSVVDHEDTTVNFERSGRTPYLYYTRFNHDTLNLLDRDIVRVPLKLTLGGPLCEGVDCDDQNACTEDICNGADSSCEHTPIECPADSNDCTAATCNPITGCEHTVVDSGTPCAGGLGTCQDGACAFPCTEQGIVDAIATGGGPYIFACAIPTTVVTTAEIVIDNDVILDGQGQLTVDGNQRHRVFSVPTGTTAELVDLTVTGGTTSEDGGGIDNHGALTLTDATVHGNTAVNFGGGLNNHGSLVLTNTTVANNTARDGGGIVNHRTMMPTDTTVLRNTAPNGQGGGISNWGEASLLNSNLFANSADFDGGMFNAGTATLTGTMVERNVVRFASGGVGVGITGTLTMVDSSVSGNTAGDRAGIGNGGVATLVGCVVSDNTATLASGGGIVNDGTLVVTNSTFSGNAATSSGGGGMVNVGTMTLVSTTIAANSAVQAGTAIWNLGSATLRNTLIAGDCRVEGPIDSLGGNIESEGNTCGLGHLTDQVIVPAPLLNLGPLKDNGRPTMTHALLPESVAIDQIPEVACVDAEGLALAVDQRGVARPQGLACDVGAFEYADCEGSLCDDGTECTVDHCNPADYSWCARTILPDATSCDLDGEDGVCFLGACVSNACPILFFIRATPTTIPPGQTTTMIETRAQDADGLPLPLVLTLSAPWGSFLNTDNIQEPDNVVSQQATYICDRSGPVEICVEATDGACVKKLCTFVLCPS